MARSTAKFGGSNFKSAGDMAKILNAVRLYDEPPVIVVSAFYGITNELIAVLNSTEDESEILRMTDRLKAMKRESLETHINDENAREAVYTMLRKRLDDLSRVLLGTHYIGEIPPFVRDRILSYGERLSSLIVSAVLEYNGIPSIECLPEDIGLLTDGEEGNAVVDFAASESSVAAALPKDKVCVVPGFYGVSPEGRITLLGRGGSDYSAAAIARCINAASLDVWKDVDGYLSADPKSVKNPVHIARLGYSEAAELSYFGARILHPRTVEPLEDKSIPVRIFNIDEAVDLNPLSVIGPDSDAPKGPKSVTYSDDFSVLTLSGAGVGIKPGILAKVTGALDRSGINIKSVVTSQTAINIYLDEADLEGTDTVVRNLGLSAVNHIIPRKDLSVVALVGDGLGEAPDVAEGMLEALDKKGIQFTIFSVGASDAAAYAVIPRKQRAEAVVALHERYFPS
jgi:aspartokinase/homoserine dehydrogenase 1